MVGTVLYVTIETREGGMSFNSKGLWLVDHGLNNEQRVFLKIGKLIKTLFNTHFFWCWRLASCVGKTDGVFYFFVLEILLLSDLII